MLLGLLSAFGAAVLYGVASVLQAVSARRVTATAGLDPRLMLRLVRSWPYVIGTALDGIGFLLSLVALRSLPLFVVQAVVSSFLAITAVLGAVVLHMSLTRVDRVGLVVVLTGLVLLCLSATEDATVQVGSGTRWGVLVAAILLAGLAVPLARLTGATGAAALGALAGLAFGTTAVAARVLPDTFDPAVLLSEPATYGLLLAGAVALLTYPTALQRGTVTQATAPLVVAQTVAPAVVGLVLLGDRPRQGWEWVAVLGFVLAVAGALSLSRHGELHDEPARPALDAESEGRWPVS